MRSGQPPLSLKARALAYLSAREHSRSELRAKLLRPVPVKPKSARKARSLANKSFVDESFADGSLAESTASRVAPECLSDFETDLHQDLGLLDPEHTPGSELGLGLEAKVDAVLDELESLKYLSDERFVESLAHRRGSRFGVLKLKHELKSHNIAAPLAKDALEQARLSELDRATEVWARKFAALPESPEDRAKQQRFLAYRGFTPSVVYKVLKGRVSDEE